MLDTNLKWTRWAGLVLVLATLLAGVWVTRADEPRDPLAGATVQVDLPDGSTRRYTLTPEPEVASPTTTPTTQPATLPVTPPPMQVPSSIALLTGSRMAPATVHAHALRVPGVAARPTEYQFEWDFGDPNAPGRHRGFNSAHHYTQPGEYTITLTVTAPDGSRTTQQTPVRIEPDTRRDVYLSAAGNDAHLGNTPERAVRTWQRARMLMGDNVRVRLRRGDVFDTPTALRLPVKNMIFTHYGDPALPLPVLRFTGALQSIPMLEPDAKARDIVIDGFAFDSQYDTGGDKNGMPDAIRAGGELLTIRNCVFRNMGYALNANGRPRGVLVENCSAPEINSIRSYFAWVQGEDHVYRNNHVANSTREHVLRANGIERLAVIGNRFTNLDRVAQDRSDTAKGTCVIQSGSVAFVRDNVFTAGPVGVGPLADGDGLKTPEARFDVAIFENNRIDGSFVEVNHGASRVVLRNNTIDCTDGAAITVHGYNSQYKRGTDDVRIERNLARNPGTRGRFIRAYGQIGGVWVIGNVYRAPRLQPGSHGTAVIYVEAETLDSFRQISDNVWPIGQPNNFAEGGSMYVWPRWSDRRGYLDPTEWNALPTVRNDRFETLPLDAPVPAGVGALIE